MQFTKIRIAAKGTNKKTYPAKEKYLNKSKPNNPITHIKINDTNAKKECLKLVIQLFQTAIEKIHPIKIDSK